MSMEAAQKAYRKNVVLELKYRKDTIQGGSRTYLEYSHGLEGLGLCIDAATGEKVVLSESYNPYYNTAYKAVSNSTAAEGISMKERNG